MVSFSRGLSLAALGPIVLGVLVSSAACTPSHAPIPPPPGGSSVLIIILDTVRQDHLSLYGYERSTSPELDRFAEGAIVFDRAYSVAPWTLPSHASMFTGLHPIDHGASEENKFLPPDAVTLAEILTAHGYATAAFVNNPYLDEERGVTQGFQLLVDNWARRDDGKGHQKGARIGDDGARRTVSDVLDWLQEDRDPARPYFVFVNFIEAHWPYDPPQAEREIMLGDAAAPDKVVHPDLWYFTAGAYSLTQAEFRLAEGLYDGEIRYLDSQLGELLEQMERIGALDDTLVIITSDHGEMFGDHGMIGHAFAVYDSLLKVPLVVRAPGAGRPQEGLQRIDSPVALLDVHATVLDVTGAVPPPGAESGGVSLLDALPARPMYAEYYRPVKHLEQFERLHPEFDASAFDRRLRVIRDDDYKLIWGSDGSRSLYRVSEDPRELVDLAEREPQRVLSLSRQLEAWVSDRDTRDLESGASRADAPELSPEKRKALEALGYVE